MHVALAGIDKKWKSFLKHPRFFCDAHVIQHLDGGTAGLEY